MAAPSKADDALHLRNNLIMKYTDDDSITTWSQFINHPLTNKYLTYGDKPIDCYVKYRLAVPTDLYNKQIPLYDPTTGYTNIIAHNERRGKWYRCEQFLQKDMIRYLGPLIFFNADLKSSTNENKCSYENTIYIQFKTIKIENAL